MRYSVSKENDVLILSLKEKLDAITSKTFQDEFLKLIQDGEINFIIDCSQLDYISSAGLRVFYLALRKLENTNGKIAFCSPNEKIMRTFDIVFFSDDFPVHNSLDEALKIF